ncbi:hypothetical protein HMPREF0063_10071 [Aeromicrobium marinum DSM 15272]|uniref:Uncharacterized protein n=1 Tax=Aeromicrobium marinum DSM 15272 TaxID=585531 RepID=E2S7R4_9ACTN|nr:hypothetical protein [Aeromicrobium marinum]EFQ84730.1 hypothetical protein HMPREF0063_10071 [Aeromicrobium marinum DSM 15272]
MSEPTVILCGNSMAVDMCLTCGGWLHREVRGGYVSGAWRYCSEDCVADQQEFEDEVHLRCRDMLCDCPEVCAPRGLPNAAQLAEWAAYLDAKDATDE